LPHDKVHLHFAEPASQDIARLFIKQNRDPIIGKPNLGVAGTSAHDCGVVVAGLDSLFEQVWERWKIGRRIMQDEGRDVTSGITAVQCAGAARVVRLAQQPQPARPEFRVDDTLLLFQR
jgi:hypothetical protein